MNSARSDPIGRWVHRSCHHLALQLVPGPMAQRAASPQVPYATLWLWFSPLFSLDFCATCRSLTLRYSVVPVLPSSFLLQRMDFSQFLWVKLVVSFLGLLSLCVV